MLPRLEDLRSWLLSDAITAWLLDITPSSFHADAISALYSLVLKLSESSFNAIYVEPSKTIWIGIEFRSEQFFIIAGGRSQKCPYTLSQHMQGIEFEPRSLVNGLPELLKRQGLKHSKDSWGERSARFCEIDPDPKDFFKS